MLCCTFSKVGPALADVAKLPADVPCELIEVDAPCDRTLERHEVCSRAARVQERHCVPRSIGDMIFLLRTPTAAFHTVAPGSFLFELTVAGNGF